MDRQIEFLNSSDRFQSLGYSIWLDTITLDEIQVDEYEGHWIIYPVNDYPYIVADIIKYFH